MKPGEIVGRYRVEHRSGRAHHGERFVAAAPDGERVFLRYVPLALDADGTARLQRELAVLRRLDCPGVLPIRDWGRLPRALWIARRHEVGERLAERLAGGPLELTVALSVALDLARTLATLHAAGVVVRDLTPEGVLLSEETGTARLVDLGLASVEDALESSRSTLHGLRLGDPRYLPPEYIADLELSPATDLYGLGCVLFEMLVGRPPFVGSPRHILIRQLGSDVPRPGAHVRVPGPVDALVARLLAKTPAERPEGAAEVVGALDGFLGQTLQTDLEAAPAW